MLERSSIHTVPIRV